MIYLQSVQQRSWILPVQLTMKSFLNPYDNTTQFIVVFNNVWLPAPWRSCPHCIYFLSDARPNNSVIPCGPTTQTAQTPVSLPLAPLPHPWRRWQPRSPSSLPLFSISHCSALSFSSTLFSHLVAAPTSSTPSSLGWLAHLGKVKSAQMPALWSFRFEMLHKVEPNISILILAHETQEDSLTWKKLPRCLWSRNDFSADHVLGILYWRLVHLFNISHHYWS